ncbi:hypothetical protein PHLGIDRAFT_18684 [Phlebiopsis gigantea 11061_1 CR5-6]|uniref:Uncharacterized protein n=1 Tax=Phlebiopsis gigantea (strain 11061_1 CR5-6) TaxID=745531 RepID=A0A0C3SD23_PHLG1|nr:hypothetical protein PHLGIDRAFT_18684 [Phlebiopsis gigantea 11061_1 CR5-6]
MDSALFFEGQVPWLLVSSALAFALCITYFPFRVKDLRDIFYIDVDGKYQLIRSSWIYLTVELFNVVFLALLFYFPRQNTALTLDDIVGGERGVPGPLISSCFITILAISISQTLMGPLLHSVASTHKWIPASYYGSVAFVFVFNTFVLFFGPSLFKPSLAGLFNILICGQLMAVVPDTILYLALPMVNRLTQDWDRAPLVVEMSDAVRVGWRWSNSIRICVPVISGALYIFGSEHARLACYIVWMMAYEFIGNSYFILAFQMLGLAVNGISGAESAGLLNNAEVGGL